VILSFVPDADISNCPNHKQLLLKIMFLWLFRENYFRIWSYVIRFG